MKKVARYSLSYILGAGSMEPAFLGGDNYG